MTFKTTGLRFAASASTALLALSGLAACGGGGAATTAATTEAAPVEATTVAATTEEAKEPSYAEWGYTNLPYNEDFDILYSSEYYAEYTNYYVVNYDGTQTVETSYWQTAVSDAGYTSVEIDADGNLLQKNARVDGKQISADYMYGVYIEYGDTDESETSDDEAADADYEDDFTPTVTYVGTGTGAVELTDDSTEYTYYEYTDIVYSVDENGNETQDTFTKKLYVQDSKLVALVDTYQDGYTYTTVYTKIQKEIPDGFMTLPDVTGLEKQELNS